VSQHVPGKKTIILLFTSGIWEGATKEENRLSQA